MKLLTNLVDYLAHQGHDFCGVLQMYFLAPCAPQAEFHLVPLYWGEGRHLYCRYLQNVATHTKTFEMDKQYGSRMQKYALFDLVVNCPFKHKK